MPTSMFWCYQCECEVAVTAARDEEKLCPQCNSGFVEELGHEGRFYSPRGSSITTNESSNTRNSSVIFRRGFVSDLGVRAENQARVAVTAARDEEKLYPQCNSGFVEELGHEGVGEDVGGSSTSGAGLPLHFHPELPAEDEAYGRGQGENDICPTPEENGGLTIWGLPGGGFAVGRFFRPRGSSITTNESSSSRNSSVIFRRRFVSDLGIRAENQAQGRRSNPLSFLWPFRSSNTNSESSSNNGTSRC